MFIWLLVVTLAVSALVCFIATRFFDKPIGSILTRLVSEELSFAWHRYITFAIYVVGISGGGRIWALERYITPNTEEASVVQLNAARWTLEVYRTIVETLQGIAWMLLVFFIFALIAYVIVRGFELRQGKRGE
ncbi:hypothetical protein ACYCFL_17230 [Stutzerimonas nitrititolerans]|uniref:Uncharacterized protein n=3 Tax=Stutzerimonas nitrititolerans TaxID=2482751 RepID=A0AA42BEP0_9GAMM|nr:hypothetical protein [Stutzerimonas nitrititolerans]AFN77051.1 hypothetical protein PSJM300_04875 [Stutzerimonas stutzeri DSM 10701]RRV17154.1 hypothetical protein EGJ29_19775 [Pseudomonas sp. s199]SUD83659.1 Uncharacterised protein [Stutzerimonas stutzeri]MBT1121312.1 hypothetical protein [Stutzerimonas nitrititolerans]MCO7546596.1 hypothetical protein [Stutzerimonas nitrititolerans]